MKNKEAIENLPLLFQEIENALAIIKKRIEEDSQNKSEKIKEAARQMAGIYEEEAKNIKDALLAGDVNSAKEALLNLKQTVKEMNLMKNYKKTFNEE